MDTLESSIDARMSALLQRVPSPPRCTSGDERAVEALRDFGAARGLPTDEIALAMNLLRGPNDVLIILLQPASTLSYTGPFEAQICESPTLRLVDKLIRMVTRDTRCLFTVSVADSSSFNVQPRGRRHKDDVEPFRAEGHALLRRILELKRPRVALCLWSGGCTNEVVRMFQGAKVGAPLREAGAIVPVEDHLINVVRSFHPSYAVNYHPENLDLQRLLLLDFARAFSVLDNRWREEPWIAELRNSCRRFARSCRDTKALVAAEEGIAELQPATAEDEEVSSSDAESTESEEPSKHAIITRVLVEACNAGKSPSNSLSMLVLLDLCAARDGIDGDRHLAVHWAKHLHEDAAGGVVDFLGEITLGYGSCNVWAILEFFRKDITELTRFRLQEANANAATDRRKAKRDRLILADLLQVCLDEAAAGVLVTSNYFAEPWEWAIDPIYEADDYYEHELRLATDGEYANICSKKRAEKERLLEMGHVECQEEWVRLFERALEFVREGPRAGFSSNEGAGGVGQKSETETPPKATEGIRPLLTRVATFFRSII